MAIAAGCVWEVRTTGSDANGGGFIAGASGTDYSQQDAAQLDIADMASATTTTVSSALTPFTSAHVGNILNITGGGAYTTGRYQVVSVAAGVATLDRACTGIVDTGGTGKLGGAVKSPAIAAANVTAGNTVYVKSGTYSCSSSSNVADGRPAPAAKARWIGYNSSRGDLSGLSGLWSANMPSLKATSNSMTIFTSGANDASIENIEFDGDKANRSSTNGITTSGSTRLRTVNCRVKNCAGTGFTNVNNWVAIFCESRDNTNHGFQIGGVAVCCLARGNTFDGFRPNTSAVLYIGCASAGNTLNGFGTSGGFPAHAKDCVAYGNSGDGFQAETGEAIFVNCISYGNTGYGFNSSTAAGGIFATVMGCATGGNTAGDFNSTNIPTANKIGHVTLTGNPFANAGSYDFSLNSTSGAGAACKAVGIGSFPSGASTGYPDIGAVQSRGGVAAPIIR